MEIICFYAGIAFVYTRSFYVLIFFVIALGFQFNWRYILYGLLGVGLALFHEWEQIDKAMPKDALITHALLVGTVASIPMTTATKSQFQFQLARINNRPVHSRIRLSCYSHCPSIKAGERWQLVAKLKRIRNISNPGGYDFERAMRAAHIEWQGNFTANAAIKLRQATSNNLLFWRERLAKNFEAIESDEEVIGMIEAITLGITTHLTSKNWDLFRKTGTTHLMVISGAHIGLVAGLSYQLFFFIWCRLGRMALYIEGPKIAAIMALLLSLLYVLMAGFAIPAQRSWLSTLVLLARFFTSKRFSTWQAWRFGLLVVLIFEPHAVLLPGFYLSFIAVAILVLVSQRVHFKGIRQMLALQAGCLLGLMPLTLYWFSYGAIDGFLANLLAIPLVGFIMVPIGLLTMGAASLVSIHWLTWPVHLASQILLTYLNGINYLSTLNLTYSFHTIFWPFIAMFAMVQSFLLPIRAYRYFAFINLVCLFFPSYPVVKMGEWRLDVLDVGQGLSVVVKTAHHILVYDTGMAFFQGGDMATLAIIPYLKTQGIHKIDTVVISHPDLDHRGGLATLQAQYPIAQLLVDNPSFYHQGKPCHQIPPWQWDGVSFQFFPIDKIFSDRNNSSCVLKITSKVGSVLLPGDIEKPAEAYLVDKYHEMLASTVLVAAHHGSKTSSSRLFIDAVMPQYVALSYGFDNRYHFPHQATLRILNDHHINLLNTVDCGMISFLFSSHPLLVKPRCFRHDASMVES